ncbi:two pore domain potassium channel family protein [Telmatocola sphagniphila]|uniref:Two pore domain potassium channel family protein n=1 Tax=Telmatocola sphagniphila TaxID=1123043 RepID=A0A8E6B9G2_9BACT|nr:potassium channel family protein [Telmatocola sphagniphila]QVL33729.1 two pore domain potassium channel family protein [Telmatocola sphagniphila]
MSVICFFVAILIIGIVFLDTFEAMILPRRVRHPYRPARVFYRSSWTVWSLLADRIAQSRTRQAFLSIFGPLSMFVLIIVWAIGLIFGFALLHWSLGTPLGTPANTSIRLTTYVYFSGTTFFTLGYGDVVPIGMIGRSLSIMESGIGFGFLALVISYLPVLYQAFSRREIIISLLDARAGSPPSAGEFLRRASEARSLMNLGPLLIEWERWAAELLESHLSFPVLRFYRSQHDNQSWLAALTMILDSTAFLIANSEEPEGYQARLTFAMARHAAVDLVLVSQTTPSPLEIDRLPPSSLKFLSDNLKAMGYPVRKDADLDKALDELRSLYEPFVNTLSQYLKFPLPEFVLANQPVDNWQTSPGMPRSPGLSSLQDLERRHEHWE